MSSSLPPTGFVEGLLPWMQGPDAWESLTNQLLRLTHGLGNYQPIPARHGGDYGIDGFSSSGHVYQCYACTEPVTTNDRYTAQKKKLRVDTQKFIDNESKLKALFQSKEVKYWILLVPQHDSAQLVTYSVQRAKEVRDKDLPYVHDDFVIRIMQLADLAIELASYMTAGRSRLQLPTPTVTDDVLQTFLSTENEFVANLRRKVFALTGKEGDALAKDVAQHVRQHLLAESLLDSLRRDANDLWNNLTRCRDSFESNLSYNSDSKLGEHLLALRTSVEKEVGLSEADSSQIARGTISLVLGNCSLEP